jgi:hypothetical protein
MYADKLIVVVLVHLKIKSIALIIQELGLVMEEIANVLNKFFNMCPFCSNPFVSIKYIITSVH